MHCFKNNFFTAHSEVLLSDSIRSYLVLAEDALVSCDHFRKIYIMPAWAGTIHQ